MPPPQQLLSSAVSSITKRFNTTFLVLVVFLIVALPLSTPSASNTNQSQQKSSAPSSNKNQQQYSSSNTSQKQQQQEAKEKEEQQQKWKHWSANLGEICPSAKPWTTHPGSFCITLWNSPYLTNRTELEIREGRAIQFYCEMDSILERFDCTQEYSVNVQKRQCKLCRDAYREWACAMVTDTLEDGQLDCETKLMPCPSCASICHQVMRLCPYLSPDRSQWDREGKLAPHVSQYGGHPAFYCPLENDDPSDPAYTSLCFHRSPFDPDYVHNICTDPPIFHHKDYYAQQTYNHDNHHHHHPQNHEHQEQQYVSSHPGRNNKNSYYSSGPAQDFNSPNKKRFNRNPKPIKSSSSISSSSSSYPSASSSFTTTTSTSSSSSGNSKRGVRDERWKNRKKDFLPENKQDGNKLNNNKNPNNNNQHEDKSNVNYYNDEDDGSPEALPRKSSRQNVNYFTTKIDYDGIEDTEESFITYGDSNNNNFNDDGDDYNWNSATAIHYTTCCWTYASSVVHFSTSQAYPEYGSDSYFDSQYHQPGISDSSSFIPRLTSTTTTSSSGDSTSSTTTSTTLATSSEVNRKPSSSLIKSDNRVILNCCDKSGVCTSNDPIDVDLTEDDFDGSGNNSDKTDEIDSSSSSSHLLVSPGTSHSDPDTGKPKVYKSSRKRSSESINSSQNHPYFHLTHEKDDVDDDESLKRDNKKSTHIIIDTASHPNLNTNNNLKAIPMKRVDPDGDVNIIEIADEPLEPLSQTKDSTLKISIHSNNPNTNIVNDQQSSKIHNYHHGLDMTEDVITREEQEQQVLGNSKDDDDVSGGDGDDPLLLPKPTHIPPGLDYDEHYLDTEPDGDGGSSSTELEDDYNVFENTNGFETRTRTLPVIESGGESTRSKSSSKGPGGSNNIIITTKHNNVIDDLHEPYKDEDSIEFTKDPSERRSGDVPHYRMTIKNTNNDINNKYKITNSKLTDDDDSSISSSVHYPKNAFMAIVIGGDDVDRRHLDLRTGVGGGRGTGRSVGGGGGGVSSSHLSNVDDNILSSESERNHLESFEPFHFSDEGNLNNEEIYYNGRTKTEEFEDGLRLSPHSSFVHLPETLPAAARSSASSTSSFIKSPFKFLFILLFPSVVQPLNSKASTIFPTRDSSMRTFDLTECCHLFLILLLIIITTSNVLPVLLLSGEDDHYVDYANNNRNNKQTSTMRRVKVPSTFTCRNTLGEIESHMHGNKHHNSSCQDQKGNISNRIDAGFEDEGDEIDNQKRFYDDIRKPNYNYYYYNCEITGVPVLKTFHYCNSTATTTTTKTTYSDTHSRSTESSRRSSGNCYYDNIDNDNCTNNHYSKSKKNYTNTEKTGRPFFFLRVKNSEEKTSKILRNYYADHDDYYGSTDFFEGADYSSSSSSNRLFVDNNNQYKNTNNNMLYYKMIKFFVLTLTVRSTLCISNRSKNIVINISTTNNIILMIIITSLGLMSIKHKKGRSNGAFFNLKNKTKDVSISPFVLRLRFRVIQFIQCGCYDKKDEHFHDYYCYYYCYEDETDCDNDDTNGITPINGNLCNRNRLHKKMFTLLLILLFQVFLANYSYSGFPLIDSTKRRVTKNKSSEHEISRVCKKGNSDLLLLMMQTTRVSTRVMTISKKLKANYCTTNSNTITDYDYDYSKRYGYHSNRILLLILLFSTTKMVMIINIINKIIKIVVQYSNEDDEYDWDIEIYNYDNLESTDNGFDKKFLKFYEHYSKGNDEREQVRNVKFPSKSYSKFLDEFIMITVIRNKKQSNSITLLLIQSKEIKNEIILVETQDFRKKYFPLGKVILKKFSITVCFLPLNYILINHTIRNCYNYNCYICHKCFYLRMYLQNLSLSNLKMQISTTTTQLRISCLVLLLMIIKVTLTEGNNKDYYRNEFYYYYYSDESESCDLLCKNDIIAKIRKDLWSRRKDFKNCIFCTSNKSLMLLNYCCNFSYYKNCYENSTPIAGVVTFDFEQGGHFLQGQSRTLRLLYSLKVKLLKVTRRTNRFSIISSNILMLNTILTIANTNNTKILMIIDNNSEDFIVRRKPIGLGIRVRIIIIIVIFQENYNVDDDSGTCSESGSGSLIIISNQLTATIVSHSNLRSSKTNKGLLLLLLLLLIMYSYSMPYYYCYYYNNGSFKPNDLPKKFLSFRVHRRRNFHFAEIIKLIWLLESSVFLFVVNIST